MGNTFKCEEDVLKHLKHIDFGNCPNFFITGKSISALERLGLGLIEKLEEQQVMSFTGMCKHFTIMMPYYDSNSEAITFMKHLMDSISIARDCYDEYRGFVLLEFATEWSKRGKNDALNLFLEYLRKHENIRFVLLYPEINEQTRINEFYLEFFRCGHCLKIETQLGTVQQNVALFKTLAADKGYKVSDDAGRFLYRRLKERDELHIDNTDVLVSLLEQIIFDKEYNKVKTKNIVLGDISRYLPVNMTETKPQMGFAI